MAGGVFRPIAVVLEVFGWQVAGQLQQIEAGGLGAEVVDQLVAIRRECAELAIEIELVDAIAIGGGEVLGEPLPPFVTLDAAPS